MSRPGTEVVIADVLPPAAAATDTGVSFIIGEAERGPADPVPIRTLKEKEAAFGPRGTFADLHDGIESYFRSGGALAYVKRLVSDNAVVATVTASGVTVKAASAGTWGNRLEIEVGEPEPPSFEPPETEALTFAEPPPRPEPKRKRADQVEPPAAKSATTRDEPEPLAVTVTLDGTEVERSAATLLTAGDLVAWSTGSAYVAITATDLAAELAAATYKPTGGTNGTVPVSDPYALRAAGLSFDPALGPGQLQAPGKTVLAQHEALLRAAGATGRVALLDGDPNASEAALRAHVAALRTVDEHRFGAIWPQRAVIPGLAAGTARSAAWSALQSGLIAAQDATGGPNQAAAGAFGVANYADGLSREFDADTRERLMYAGVNVAAVIYGQVRGYGFRTLAAEDGRYGSWLFLNNVRLAMAIRARADAIAERYLFRSIDGRKIMIGEFRGELAGMCSEYWPTGLYGETIEDAFVIRTEDPVNTPESIQRGEVRAIIGLHMAPPAEWIYIEIVKRPITEPL